MLPRPAPARCPNFGVRFGLAGLILAPHVNADTERTPQQQEAIHERQIGRDVHTNLVLRAPTAGSLE